MAQYDNCGCGYRCAHDMEEQMADTVQVNGVTLTREQVERALAELNKPFFRAGDIVTWANSYLHKNKQYIVLVGPVGDLCTAAYLSSPLYSDYARFTDGISSFSGPSSTLTKVGKLA